MQVRPWSKVSGTAAAPSGSARSSSRVTRRRRKPRSTMPSSLQMCTEGKCCSCIPSLVSKNWLSPVYLTDDSSLLPQWHVNVKRCLFLCKCKNSFMYLFILRNLPCVDLHHNVCISTSYRPIHTVLIIIALMGEIIHCLGDGHHAAE